MRKASLVVASVVSVISCIFVLAPAEESDGWQRGRNRTLPRVSGAARPRQPSGVTEARVIIEAAALALDMGRRG